MIKRIYHAGQKADLDLAGSVGRQWDSGQGESGNGHEIQFFEHFSSSLFCSLVSFFRLFSKKIKPRLDVVR